MTNQSKPSSSEVRPDAPSGENSTKCETGSEKKVIRVAPGTLFKREENGDRLYEAEPDCYNGARRDNFSWSQKHREIDIQVKIPEHIKSSKQLTVKIEKKHIKICENGVAQPIIDSNLSMDIKTETAQWSFEVDEHLVSLFWSKFLVLIGGLFYIYTNPNYLWILLADSSQYLIFKIVLYFSLIRFVSWA